MSESELLQALGFPQFDPQQPALSALHAGAAYHQLAIVQDVVEAYTRDARLPDGEPAYVGILRGALRNEPARTTADSYYHQSVAADPRLAEAWFNLGRIEQDARDDERALAAFDRCVALDPHARALPHAHLHANAHWHAANVHEDAGRDEKALERYRRAVSMCDNFGVHHVRYAHFLRRLGLVEEAIPQYEKMMVYSHRYFTEFVLPPLQVPAVVPPAQTLDVIYETSAGDAVVFWDNAYYRLPGGKAPVARNAFTGRLATDRTLIGRFLARLVGARSPQKAASISDFE